MGRKAKPKLERQQFSHSLASLLSGGYVAKGLPGQVLVYRRLKGKSGELALDAAGWTNEADLKTYLAAALTREALRDLLG